jgi:penicillin-binding protein 1C
MKFAGLIPKILRIKWFRFSVAGLAAGALGYACLPDCDLYPRGITWSREVRDHEGKVLHLTLTQEGRYRLFTPLHDISPDVIEATLWHEDRQFRHHPGVNPLSILRAMWGVVSGSRMGGGSTITMQYARLRFGLETRSVGGKFLQILRALQIERHHSKDQILEAYLNLAPYGGNVEGIGAAGLLWCGRSAAELSLREAVALSVIPQSPARRRPREGKPNTALAEAQARLIGAIQSRRGMTPDPLESGYTLIAGNRAPREAPHLSRRLLQQQPDQQHITSTLDRESQRAVERTLAAYVERKHEFGINNACALLVHAPSRRVLAYAGSARFLDSDILGQVDGVTARRSPGSALKPFIYGLALDQGLIHPRSLLVDGRVSFGSYNPENFDRTFIGPLPAGEALFRSRNIPAVSLAHQLAAPGLYGFLKSAGVAFPKPESYYGLALPLGGAEVSMEEMAGLYAMIASDGQSRPLQFTASDSRPTKSRSLLSPQACFLLRQMLRAPADDPDVADHSVGWKTGTSHGFRDAWAAGIRGDYVIVVWIGNFNGKPNPSFVARECATPLLFECFRQLNLPRVNDVPPTGVEELELCAVSGQLPTPCCLHRSRGWFIPGVSPIAPCSIHREIWIDTNTGLRVAANDGRPGLHSDVYEFWEPSLLELFKKAGLPRREPPPLEQSRGLLAAAGTTTPPRITSPVATLVYTLRSRTLAAETIPLRAEAAPGVRKLYWFDGRQFLGVSDASEPLLWNAQPGRRTLQVLDDQGRSTACSVRIEQVD